jgi:hypothetical protein
VKYEFQIGKQCGLVPHVDGTPWSFIVALNDSKEYAGGGTHFINNEITCRPQKAGSSVLFSGKILHEGLAITSGVRYILTGFCEYVYESDPDVKRCPHALFLRDYDVNYDGYAALGGIQTGDVIKGVFDANCLVHYVNEDNSIHSVLDRIRHHPICPSIESELRKISITVTEMQDIKLGRDDTKSVVSTKKPQCSLLVERLISTEYSEEEAVDCVTNITNQVNGSYDDNLTVSARNIKKDDQDILDLIHGVDQFFTVGQYWQFDE